MNDSLELALSVPFCPLGAAKKFRCAACGTCVGRDLNGARNNFFAAFGAASGMGWDGIHR